MIKSILEQCFTFIIEIIWKNYLWLVLWIYVKTSEWIIVWFPKSTFQTTCSVYDCLSHDLLVAKLEAHGLGIGSLDFLSDYLSFFLLVRESIKLKYFLHIANGLQFVAEGYHKAKA